MSPELERKLTLNAFLTKKEAADYLSCSTKSLERFMRAGLKYYSLTKHPTFRRSDLDSFANQFMKGAA
jgi:hypothetical protein